MLGITGYPHPRISLRRYLYRLPGPGNSEGKGNWLISQMKAWDLERWPDLVKVMQGGEEEF